MRGSRRNSKSQPTIDGGDERDAQRERCRPGGFAAEPGDESHARAIVIASAATPSHAELLRRQWGTTASAKSSNAAVPTATVDSSVSPALGRQHLAEVEGKRHGEHARRHQECGEIGGADLHEIRADTHAPATLPASRNSRYGASSQTPTTDAGTHSAPAVTSRSTTSGCCTFRRSS